MLLTSIAAAFATAAESPFALWSRAIDHALRLRPHVAGSPPRRSGRAGSVRREARAALKRRNVLRNRTAHKRAARK